MSIARIGLWSLAIVAGAVWLLQAAISVSHVFGTTVLASWAISIGIPELDTPLDPLFLVPFLTAIVLSNILCGARFTVRPAPLSVAIRGAPRWLKRTIFLGSVAIILISLAYQSSTGTGVSQQLNVALSTAINAALGGFLCLLLVSAARVGLLPPKCPNGHPVGYDMDECSLCGAPIKNVEF